MFVGAGLSFYCGWRFSIPGSTEKKKSVYQKLSIFQIARKHKNSLCYIGFDGEEITWNKKRLAHSSPMLELYHSVKSIRIWSLSGLYFPAFGVFLRIPFECGKIRTRKTPNTDTFHAVYRSQTIGFQCKSIDWFLYVWDIELRWVELLKIGPLPLMMDCTIFVWNTLLHLSTFSNSVCMWHRQCCFLYSGLIRKSKAKTVRKIYNIFTETFTWRCFVKKAF